MFKNLLDIFKLGEVYEFTELMFLLFLFVSVYKFQELFKQFSIKTKR